MTAVATAQLRTDAIYEAGPAILRPTPTRSLGLKQRVGGFSSLVEALDYAARGETGFNFYSGRGELMETLPYALLRRRAEEAARRLLSLRFRRGDRVALLAETTPDFLSLFFGCQYAGLIPVPLPLPTGLGARQGYVQQLRRQIEGAGARAAFGSQDMAGYLEAAVADLGLDRVGTPEDLREVPESLRSLDPLGAEDLSYLQYSSGSTRFPLGVAVRMRALMSNAMHNAVSGLKVSAEDRSVSWLPLYHDMGLVGFVVTPLIAQSSVDLLPSQEFARRPLVWLDLLSRNRSTISYSPTFGYEICVRRAERASDLSLDLSCWRAAGIGGDMIRPEVLRRFSRTFAPHGFRRRCLRRQLRHWPRTRWRSVSLRSAAASRRIASTAGFSPRRTSPSRRPKRPEARAFALCGKPLPEHALEIRDERGSVLSDRRVGRIFINGPSLMAGYFNQPEATAPGHQRRRLAGHRRPGLFDRRFGGRDRPRQGPDHRQRPQHLAAGHRMGGRADRRSCARGDVAAFSVDEAGFGESVVVLVQCRTADPQEVETLSVEVKGVVNRTAAVDCVVVPVPPRSLPQTSSGKLSRSKAKHNYLAGQYRPLAAAEPLLAAE